MTKEKLEIYQELYTKSQLKRTKVVDEYLNNFGELQPFVKWTLTTGKWAYGQGTDKRTDSQYYPVKW